MATSITAPSPQSASPASTASFRRPEWLSSRVPPLDGLRGLAILSVVVYHCHPLLAGTFLHNVVIWWWSGVVLFFCLSGFLITGVLLDAPDTPGFYKNFFARRCLRIWPGYWLLLFLEYLLLPLVFGGPRWMCEHFMSAPWLFLMLYIQNIPHLALAGSIIPTWSLAIEQQYYIFWAPLARNLKARGLFIVVALMFLTSPMIRQFGGHGMAATNTLIHLDGLSVGCGLAIALRTFRLSLNSWRWIGRAGIAIGISGVALMFYRGTAWTDSLLALGYGGFMLAAIVGQASLRPSLLTRFFSLPPLRFVGMVSYGVYLTHVVVFSLLGGIVDARLMRFGLVGNIAIVIIRTLASVGVAALMWYNFEKPILDLKRYFAFRPAQPKAAPAATASAPAPSAEQAAHAPAAKSPVPEADPA